jgi:hypothetical protein
MRAISSLRKSFFFLSRLSWRASALPDYSSALMALSRSRCSCFSLSSVVRSSRISSLSMGRPLLLVLPLGTVKSIAAIKGARKALGKAVWRKSPAVDLAQGVTGDRRPGLDKTPPI